MNERTLKTVTGSFVETLNQIVVSAIHTDVRFVAELTSDRKRASVEASRAGIRSDGFPLVRAADDPSAPVLLMKGRYMVELAGDGTYIRVVTSAVGLWVDVTGGRKNHRPLIRIEYDRYPRTADRPAAHVHLHANSPEMAWVYGSSGRAAPDLHALHFPVGGPRFRPTLEDFLLFLNREKLYTDFKPGWKREVLESLRQWERIQAAATATRYPGTAARALKKLGYAVSSPGDSLT